MLAMTTWTHSLSAKARARWRPPQPLTIGPRSRQSATGQSNLNISSLLQVSTLLYILICGVAWAWWAGFFRDFGLTPQSAGISAVDLFIAGAWGGGLALILLLCAVVVLYELLWVRSKLLYLAALLSLPIGAAILGWTFEGWSGRAVMVTAVAFLGILVPATSGRHPILVKICLVVGLLLVLVSYDQAYDQGARRAYGLYSHGEYVSGRTYDAGGPLRFRVHAIPAVSLEKSGKCGYLIGVHDGYYAVSYPSEDSNATRADMFESVRRLPIDDTRLTPCHYLKGAPVGMTPPLGVPTTAPK